MIVYHGSRHNFKQFRVSESLASSASLNNEGAGVYFSRLIDVAESYGRYVYVINIDDSIVLDFRNPATCYAYVYNLYKELHKCTGLMADKLINTKLLVDYMCCGNISIFDLGAEVFNLLDSNELFYQYSDDSRVDRVRKFLNQYGNKTLMVYMFPYHIQECGIIKKSGLNYTRIVKKFIV